MAPPKRSWLALAAVLGSCQGDIGGGPETTGMMDVDIGERPSASGDWSVATRCKMAMHGGRPDWQAIGVDQLADPEITISVDGLTLHLVDRAGTYDRVFPVGVGKVSTDETEFSFGESYSMDPVILTGDNHFTLDATDTRDGNWNFNPCRVWWTSAETGELLPVFAGLPFMRLQHPSGLVGAYGIHGPVTDYTAENGGNLVRGYVSHGCIRMEAADVIEVYAAVRGHGAVPVRIQREPERTWRGERVDVEDKWIGSECQADSDCNFDGGYCADNPYGRGFCSQSCTSVCPDREGQPSTFCVSDPVEPTEGMCVRMESPRNFECRTGDHLQPARMERHSGDGTIRTVCMPGSRGWVGDLCVADGDCQQGNRCETPVVGKPGVCTRDCYVSFSGNNICEDMPGTPWTLCVSDVRLGGETCLRQCDPASLGSECPVDWSCSPRFRAGDYSEIKHVCMPPAQGPVYPI